MQLTYSNCTLNPGDACPRRQEFILREDHFDVSLDPATFRGLIEVSALPIQQANTLTVATLLTGKILPSRIYTPVISKHASGTLHSKKNLKPGECVWASDLNGVCVFGIGILGGNGDLLRELERASNGDPRSALSGSIGAVTQEPSTNPRASEPQATFTIPGSAALHP